MFGVLKYNKYQVYTEWIIATILLLMGCTIYLPVGGINLS